MMIRENGLLFWATLHKSEVNAVTCISPHNQA